MSDDFYRVFEEEHRGPRELILQRLAAYRPFIMPLTEIYAQRGAIDLGCGRGEWLEFLQSEGFLPIGVDLDKGMLRACEERGLVVSCGDALEFMAALEDESQLIVSAIHVVEHISFEQLRTLVAEALRILKPGGLLIMETPNPENITVATCNFYLDPTHLRPIPPALLSFLPKYYRYARTKVVRLQEPETLHSKALLTVGDVLAGASPDYAVIAQKIADPGTLRHFDDAFSQDYGLSTVSLANRYDAEIMAEFNNLKALIQPYEAAMQENQQRVGTLEAKLARQDAMVQRQEASMQCLEKSVQRYELDVKAARDRAGQLFEELQAMHMSRSWRITAPLRWFSHQMHLLLSLGWRARIRALAKKILRGFARYLNRNPRARGLLVSVARKMGLASRLKALYARVESVDDVGGIARTGAVRTGLQLTPRGQDIYHALKAAVEHHNQGGLDAHRY